MKQVHGRVIAGSGGGGKGGSGSQGSAHEDPDTLATQQIARVIDVISEGEIEGFVHPQWPLTDVFLDGTPVQAGNATGIRSDGHTTINSQIFTTSTDAFRTYLDQNGHVVPGKTPDKFRWIDCKDANGNEIYPWSTTIISVESTTSCTLSASANQTNNSANWQLGGDINNRNFSFQARSGTQGQDFVDGFPAVEVTFGDGREVRHDTSWVQVFTDVTLDSLRVDILFPDGLEEQDMSTGNIHGFQVHLQFYCQVQGQPGNGTLVIDDTVNGKASSAYVRTYVIDLSQIPQPAPPNPQPGWQLTIMRVTGDDLGSNIRARTSVQSYTQVTEGKLQYPNTALIAFALDAKQFTTIPTRAYHIMGIKVLIPKNYYPRGSTTYGFGPRHYDFTNGHPGVTNGVWDGTFKTEWSDNPAWCWYDMATNNRYGLGHMLIDANIDKWTLFTVAQYCDAYMARPNGTTDDYGANGKHGVNDGAGNFEARFTCHLYLQKAEDAIKMLQDMAGMFRGTVAYVNGAVTPVQDAPTDTSAYRMFSPANVTGGVFNYSGTSMRARHNVAIVSWSDLLDNGKVKPEYVEDHDQITRTNAIQKLTISGFGCARRSQARRIGLWAIYAEKLLTDTVIFSTALEGYFIKPGQLIQIQDPFRAGKVLSGRIRTGSTATNMILDRNIVLETGNTYQFYLVDPQQGLVSETVTTPSNGQSVSSIATQAFPNAPDPDSLWQMVITASPVLGDLLVPEVFRVLSVIIKDDASLEITALQYNKSLYGFVDFNYPLDVPPISQLPPVGACMPPVNFEAAVIQIIMPDGHIRQDLEVIWSSQGDASYSDGVLTSPNLLSSNSAGFTQTDVGKIVSGTGITLNSSIKSIVSSSQVVLSQNVGGGGVNFTIHNRGPDPYLASYRPTYRKDNGNWLGTQGEFETDVATFRLVDVTPNFYDGIYEFKIFAVNILGATSAPLYGEQHVDSPPTHITGVTGLELFGGNHYNPGNTNAIFQTRDAHFDWRVAGTGQLGSTQTFPPVGKPLGGTSGDAMATGFKVWIYHDTTLLYPLTGQDSLQADSEFIYTLDMNLAQAILVYGQGASPIRIFRIEVAVEFNDSTESPHSTLTVENPPPGQPTNVTKGPAGGGGLVFQWTNPDDPDLDHVILFATTSPSGPPNATNIVARFPGGSMTGVYFPPDNRTYYYWLAEVDSFGTYSGIVSIGFTSGGGVIPPTFTPPGGTYPTAQTVTISQQAGCNLFYCITTLGTPPGKWNTYTAPVTVSATATLHAHSVLQNDQTQNAFSEADYTIGAGNIGAPTFNPPPGAYTINYPGALKVEVTGPSGTWLSTTQDGTTPTPANGYPQNYVILQLSESSSPVTLQALAFVSPSPPGAVSSITSGVYVIQFIGGGACAEPDYAPKGGSFANYPINVTISCYDPSDAYLIYTTDGTIPSNTNGTTVPNNSVVQLTQPGYLKAFAFHRGRDNSPVHSVQFMGPQIVANPAFSPSGGGYSSFPVIVTITCATQGASINYTLDGSPPSETHGTTVTSGATVSIAVPGTQLRAIGFMTNWTDSQIVNATYTGQMPTPTHNPDNSTYASGSTLLVTVDCPSPPVTANIIYTLDGTTPSRTSPVNGTIVTSLPATVSISGGYRVLQSIAFDPTPNTKYADSVVKTSTYNYITKS
jgi:predicted phage tail protein